MEILFQIHIKGKTQFSNIAKSVSSLSKEILPNQMFVEKILKFLVSAINQILNTELNIQQIKTVMFIFFHLMLNAKHAAEFYEKHLSAEKLL